MIGRDRTDDANRSAERGRSGEENDRARGQLVLAAAAVIAIALVPIVLAYLQLGYHPDVRAESDHAEPSHDAERMLSRAVHEAALATNASWSDRRGAVDEVRNRLRPRLETLRSARVERGTAYEVAYNQSAASAWAANNCPSGPDRQFGPCEPRRGVVIQERADEVHVLAVAFDVTITTERGTTELRILVRSVGGVGG